LQAKRALNREVKPSSLSDLESFDSEIPGKKITRIGLGCVTFGRETDKPVSFSIMDHAIERGITFFDTAAAYGAGASETIIGEWLHDRQSISGSVLVATKIFPPYTSKNINDSVNASLIRLKKETVDLVYFHKWDDELKKPSAYSALTDLVQQGKIRMAGVCNFNTTQLSDAISIQSENDFSRIKFLQNNNNVAVRDITDDLQNICEANDVKIVSYSPLGAGFLTGKHLEGVSPGSRFDIIPGHKDVYFNEIAFARLRKLNEISSGSGYSNVEVALAWSLHHRGVSSVLVGARKTSHIDQAINALSLNLPEFFSVLDRI
jgi:1-deoxyxylulose-5-phosphate synthase